MSSYMSSWEEQEIPPEKLEEEVIQILADALLEFLKKENTTKEKEYGN